jgi:hypothetical protein
VSAAMNEYFYISDEIQNAKILSVADFLLQNNF